MKGVSATGALSIDCFPVLVETRLITVSNLTQCRPPSASQHSLDYSLQVYLHTGLITASKCIYKLALSRCPSSSPNSLDHNPEVYLQPRSINAFRCISKPPRIRPPSSHDHGLQVHLYISTITVPECISEFTLSSFSGAPQIALKHWLQPVQIYHV